MTIMGEPITTFAPIAGGMIEDGVLPSFIPQTRFNRHPYLQRLRGQGSREGAGVCPGFLKATPFMP